MTPGGAHTTSRPDPAGHAGVPARRGCARRRRLALLRIAAALPFTLLCAPAPQAGAVVGSAPDRTFATSGPVNAITGTGGGDVLGGAFGRVGPPSTGLGVVGLSNGLPEPAFASTYPSLMGDLGSLQQVSAVVSDGAGGWYIGGTFKYLHGVLRNRLAHLLADGSIDPAFDPNLNPEAPSPSTTVNALVLSGNKLYVGGQFTLVNGSVSRARLAVFDATTGAVDPTFNQASPNLPVFSLLLSGDRLYVGGQFTSITTPGGTVARNRLALVDATTGALDPTFNPNLSSSVFDMALSGDKLYAGGGFNTVNGGTLRPRLAAFDATTGVDPTFLPGMTTSSVSRILLTPSKLYAVGVFSTVNDGSVTRNQAAAFDPVTGVVDPVFDPNLAPVPTGSQPNGGLALVGSTVYIGGQFKSVNGGLSRNRIAGFDMNTGLATAFNPDIGALSGDPNVTALAVVGDRMAIATGPGGAWIGGARNNAAVVGSGGLLDHSFDANVNGPVYAAVRSGSKIYLGGAFTSVNGTVTRNGLAAVDVATGAVDTTFVPPVVGTVRSLVLSGSRLYVGGSFALSDGSLAFGNLVAVDTTTGAVQTGFDPKVGGDVRALLLSGSKLYLGGAFQLVNDGVARNRVAAVDATTGVVDAAFDPSAGATVTSLAMGSGVLYLGGQFALMNTNAASVVRNHVAAVNPTTGRVTSLNPNVNGDVFALAVSGATLYVGGTFTTVNGSVPRSNLAAFTGGIADAQFSPGGGVVRSLVADGNELKAGGDDGYRRFSQAAAPPVATSGAASAIASTSATLSGTVNPGGPLTGYVFEYGTSTAFGSISAPADAGTGTDDLPVTASLTGLQPDTTYYYRLVATSAAGTALGTVLTFHTAGGALQPQAVTLAASLVTTSTATVGGQVNPSGSPTVYTFEYGPSLSFGAITTVRALDDAHAFEPVSAPLTGLTANTTYYYRVVAVNAAGTTTGDVMRFTTTGPGARPDVSTTSATAVTASGATLTGTVDAHGIATVFTFAYGTSPSNLNAITAVDNAETAFNGPQAVGLPVGGLAPNTTYYYRLIAANAAGTSSATIRQFTTGPAA